MERIKITEQDLTSNVVDTNVTDVVYVPGFASSVIGSIVNGKTIPNVGVPTLCKSVYEFEILFAGDTDPHFAEDQAYPKQFGVNAIPPQDGTGDVETTTIMFAAGKVDPSFIYAKELLTAGISVLYERINETEEEITVAKMYEFLTGTDTFGTQSKLINKDYQIKYITSGGYPTFEYGWADAEGKEALPAPAPLTICSQMAVTAAKRGDAVVLIDHTDNAARPLIGNTSVFNIFRNYALGTEVDTYATLITPWADYTLNNVYTSTYSLPSSEIVTNYETSAILPGSFAYLLSLAQSIKTNANWLAIAGVARGLVPNLKSLHTDQLLTNAIAESYVTTPTDTESGANICINAITNIKPYGYCIWGNRTLMAQSITRTGFATGFLNLRNLVSDVKKQAFLAAQSLMFEQNTDVLWINFKSLITPLLDQMVSGYGISKYKILKGQSGDKTKLTATIRLYPIYAVESFEINVVLTDEETVIS